MRSGVAPERMIMFLMGWLLTAGLCLSLFFFAGAGYSAIVPLLILAGAAFIAASRTRWRTFQRWISGDPAIASTWSPRVAIIVLANAVLWGAITVLLVLA